MKNGSAYKLESHQVDLWRGNVIEVTGVSAIGKSSFLRAINNPGSFYVFDSGELFSLGGQKKKSIFIYFRELLLLMVFLYKNNKISSQDIKWLFIRSMKVRESFFMKLNVFRNCLLKFFNHDHAEFLCKNSPDSIIFVDEGISHIPFLLQDQDGGSQLMSEFFLRFERWLLPLKVLCLEGDVDTVDRLKKRGHKRLKGRNDEKVVRFVNLNLETLDGIKRNSSRFGDFVILKV